MRWWRYRHGKWWWPGDPPTQAPNAGNGRHRLEGVRVVARPIAKGAEALRDELDAAGLPFCAVDRNGRRYTMAVGSQRGDWWHTAYILTPSALRALREDGLLPLREVDPRTNEVIL
jgi:hypothetical protein